MNKCGDILIQRFITGVNYTGDENKNINAGFFSLFYLKGIGIGYMYVSCMF
jgi:hypothetical protein